MELILILKLKLKNENDLIPVDNIKLVVETKLEYAKYL